MNSIPALASGAIMAVMTCFGLVAGTGAGEAAPAAAAHRVAAATDQGSSWGSAQEVRGSAALNAGGVDSVSCASPGNCAAGGDKFIVDETDGTWGKAQAVNGAVISVSCASPGYCSAGGSYWDSSGREQAFVVDESGGSWGTAQEVPGSAALNTGGHASITSVSCASAGNCAAAGYYQDSSGHPQAFVADENGGSWGTAREAPGSATLNVGSGASLTSVSCASPGNCAAGGWYLAAYSPHGAVDQAFVVDESGGSWGAAQEVPGSATLNTGWLAEVTSVSCPSPGDCAAAGYYQDSSNHQQAFVADENRGSWGLATQVPGSATLNTGGHASITSVSCASAGNCAAAGYYQDSTNHQQAFVADENRGSWGLATQVPGSATLNTGGHASITSVSCPAAGYCAAGGGYRFSGNNIEPFVVDLNEASATSTSISLSRAAVAYWDERAEQVSVTVTSPSATPGGMVVVRWGTVTICTITLASGSASCALPATGIPPGSTRLTATYAGSAHFAVSASPPATLNVTMAATPRPVPSFRPAPPAERYPWRQR